MAKTFKLSQPVQMKAAVRNLWLDLLVSDQYQQTSNLLRDGTGFCCLGVLCDIHANTAPVNKRLEWTLMGGIGTYDDEADMPSFAISRWAFPELRETEHLQPLEDGIFEDTPSGRAELLIRTLVKMNDKGKSFVQIAKHIEANTVGV